MDMRYLPPDPMEDDDTFDHPHWWWPGASETATRSVRGRLKNSGVWLWRRRNRVAAAIAVVAALWFFVRPYLLGPVVSVDPVVRADFVQSVVANGHVEAPFRVNVGSQIVGVVSDVPVKEGQTVKAGDTLVVLDDREVRAAVVQAEGAVAQAEARLRQMKEVTLPSAEEALKESKATLNNAQKAYDRAEKLARDNFGTKATLDDATRALDIARARVRAGELQVFTNRPGGSDYVIAETQFNQARASLDAARTRLDFTVIKAPRDGVLISRGVEKGNVVQPSNILMTLSPTGDTQLVVQIDEKNLGLIRLGEPALVSTDAYPKDIFNAQVVYINPGVDLQRATVEVKLRVTEPPAYLRQDMTVSVDIKTAERPKALIAPASALRGMTSGKPWVMKVAGGRTKRQPVSVGLVNSGKAEILDGLKDGDLLLSATAPLEEGVRIRSQLAQARDQ